MKVLTNRLIKWVMVFCFLFLFLGCTNRDQVVREQQNDYKISENKIETFQNDYKEKVATVVLDLSDDFTEEDFKVTQIQNTSYYLISWPGSGGPLYCLYNEKKDETILFNIQSQYPHQYGDNIYSNDNINEKKIELIGTLVEEEVYFIDQEKNKLRMLETGERFFTYPDNFPTIITYFLEENVFSTERVVLNEDYTQVPGIQKPYIKVGQNSFNTIKLRSEVLDERVYINFEVVQENNNDDFSPEIYYYYNVEKKEASILFVNVIQEKMMIREDFEKIRGISNVRVEAINNEKNNGGFFDDIQMNSPTRILFEDVLKENAKKSCLYINFSINQNVKLYGEMIMTNALETEDQCSMVLYTVDK
ncbi:hypothetical protein QBE53_02695 [Vallitaleaceae bacterium 9-2]